MFDRRRGEPAAIRFKPADPKPGTVMGLAETLSEG